MRLRWERRKKVDAGQLAEEDDTFLGFNSGFNRRLRPRSLGPRSRRSRASIMGIEEHLEELPTGDPSPLDLELELELEILRP